MIKLLGENSPAIEKIIKEGDKDGDGKISFEDFLKMFREENYLTVKEEFADPDSSHSSSDALGN